MSAKSEKIIDRAYAKPIDVDGVTIPAGEKVKLKASRADRAKRRVGLFEPVAPVSEDKPSD
mgnify:CR=1 FL=1